MAKKKTLRAAAPAAVFRLHPTTETTHELSALLPTVYVQSPSTPSVLLTHPSGAGTVAVQRRCACHSRSSPDVTYLNRLAWESMRLQGVASEDDMQACQTMPALNPPQTKSVTLVLLPATSLAYNNWQFPTYAVASPQAEQQLVRALRRSLPGVSLALGQLVGCVVQGQLALLRIVDLTGGRSIAVVKPGEPVQVKLTSEHESTKLSLAQRSTISGFRRLGGMRLAISMLESTLLFPLTHPEVFFRSEGETGQAGLQPSRGILLWGIPGTGKSMLCRAVAEELHTRWSDVADHHGWREPAVVKLDATRLGERPSVALENTFVAAGKRFRSQRQCTLLIVDEIDALCPAREQQSDPAGTATTVVLLTYLDGVRDSRGVFLLATTNRPDALDEAVRRPGRVDREIEIEVPDARERFEIVCAILGEHLCSTLLLDEVRQLTDQAHGFAPADLRGWVSRAQQAAYEAAVEAEDAIGGRVRLRIEHLRSTLGLVRPSALKSLVVESPSVKWSDIGGYEAAKQALREAVEWPIVHAELFATLRISPPRGILLYGPPGNSKTLMAKAVAAQSSMNFIAVKGPEVFSKWVGETERTIRQLFSKARRHAPSVIFFDEVDAIGGDRSDTSKASGVEFRALSQLLNELDGIETARQVVTIAATNRPDLLDAALLRPGRLDRLIYIPLPDAEARRQIFEIHSRGMWWPHQEEMSYDRLAEISAGYSGAEIAMVCTQVRMECLRRHVARQPDAGVKAEDFRRMLLEMKPRTSPQLVKFYEDYAANH